MVFPRFFFNTKYSSLLKGEHHVAGSQNINKSRTLINSKNLPYSIISTILNHNIPNKEGKNQTVAGLAEPNPPPPGMFHVPPALPLRCLLEQGRGTSPGLLGPKIWRAKQDGQIRESKSGSRAAPHSSARPRAAFGKPNGKAQTGCATNTLQVMASCC